MKGKINKEVIYSIFFILSVFYSEKYWKGLDSRTSLYISSPLYNIDIDSMANIDHI